MPARLPEFNSNRQTRKLALKNGQSQMMHSSLGEFLSQGTEILASGPVAMIFIEDRVEMTTTLRHHLDCGFAEVVAFVPDAFDLPYDVESRIHRVPFDCSRREAVFDAINRVIDVAAPGCWLYYCYNAEYLFYPFSETRSVGEMLTFHAEERRAAMLTYVIDLYAANLEAHPNGVSLEDAHLDKSGYYAQARLDPETGQENFHYWFRARVHESVNAAGPVVVGDQVLLSAAYRTGSALLKIKPDGTSFDEVWRDRRNLLAHWSTPVHVDGFVYGFSGRHENEGELRCIRLADGKVMWTSSGFDGDLREFVRDRGTGKILNAKTGLEVPFPFYGRGSLTQVGNRFVVLGERGTIAVVEVNSETFTEYARFSVPEIHYPAWAAPVISNGKMYLRSEDWLVCFDLKPAPPSTSP